MTTSVSEKPIAEEIVDYYNSYDESKRLTDAFGLLERERTQELITRYLLPPSQAVILDVGGASGVYSFWLASLGHIVHLVDIVPRHIEQAKQTSTEPGSARLASIRVGDARDLDFPDEFADVIIMHGPLYHLIARGDRLRALAEAKRILRPGGVLLAFAITRYAGVVFGLTRGYVFDSEYFAMTKEEVTTGLRRRVPGWHFHHPDELKGELVDAGMIHEQTLGIIGPAWLVPNLDESWQDEAKRKAIMDVARMLEHESVLGPRIMAVARKASSRNR
jgi:SAM-dependent methyltransferase